MASFAIVEEDLEPKAAVDSVIRQAIPHVADSLLGKTYGSVDRFAYIATAYLLFEAFCSEWVDEVYWYTVVTKGAPKITSLSLTKAVDRLVEEGLFSYVDPFSVRLQARRLKWAYQRIKEYPSVTGMVSEALERLQDNK